VPVGLLPVPDGFPLVVGLALVVGLTSVVGLELDVGWCVIVMTEVWPLVKVKV
jgi:hypothetical protein